MDEATTAPKRETIRSWSYIEVWHWFKSLLVGRLRKETAREASLRGSLLAVEASLEAAHVEIKRLKNDIAERDSTIKLKDLELRDLAAINERNFRRVQAETALAAGQEGMALGPRRE